MTHHQQLNARLRIKLYETKNNCRSSAAVERLFQGSTLVAVVASVDGATVRPSLPSLFGAVRLVVVGKGDVLFYVARILHCVHGVRFSIDPIT